MGRDFVIYTCNKSFSQAFLISTVWAITTRLLVANPLLGLWLVFITPRPLLLKYVLDACYPGGAVLGQLFSHYPAVSTVLAYLSCGTQTLSCGRGRRISEERTHGSAWCSECTSLNPMGRCCRCRLPPFLWSVVSVCFLNSAYTHKNIHSESQNRKDTKIETHKPSHIHTCLLASLQQFKIWSAVVTLNKNVW